MRQTADAGEASKGPGPGGMRPGFSSGQEALSLYRVSLAIDLSEQLRTKLPTFVVSSSCSSLIVAFRVAHTLLFSKKEPKLACRFSRLAFRTLPSAVLVDADFTGLGFAKLSGALHVTDTFRLKLHGASCPVSRIIARTVDGYSPKREDGALWE